MGGHGDDKHKPAPADGHGKTVGAAEVKGGAVAAAAAPVKPADPNGFSDDPESVSFEALPERFRKPTTTPIDYRFPTTNQSRHCWTRYNEFIMCARDQAPDAAECAKLKHYYRCICPTTWVEKWDDERREGNFAGVQFAGDLE